MSAETIETEQRIPSNEMPTEPFAANRFRNAPGGNSSGALFEAFGPQVLSFLKGCNYNAGSAEDLAQKFMLTAYCKASPLPDRILFRVFRIARNALYRRWRAIPDPRERDAMILRFIEQWKNPPDRRPEHPDRHME